MKTTKAALRWGKLQILLIIPYRFVYPLFIHWLYTSIDHSCPLSVSAAVWREHECFKTCTDVDQDVLMTATSCHTHVALIENTVPALWRRPPHHKGQRTHGVRGTHLGHFTPRTAVAIDFHYRLAAARRSDLPDGPLVPLLRWSDEFSIWNLKRRARLFSAGTLQLSLSATGCVL